MDILEIAVKILFFFVPFLFALSFHEFAHGWVAKRMGDNTAEMMGRLNLNPLSHADPLGTFVLPLSALLISATTGAAPFFFGWAKPVPVNSRNLTKPKHQMFWIALAGPLSNIFLAFVGAFVYQLFVLKLNHVSYAGGVMELTSFFIIINLFLAVFNLLPLHPLDGGKIISRFLSVELDRKLEHLSQYSFLIFMGLILFGAFAYLAIPVYYVRNVFLWVWANLIGLV
ncbi:MAG: site-2 protease family protein [Bdellovibrionales bacterium CG10_big_fil_rev_8_21_14_0_10_45_34]|nr:MAG: site-2 protease family protein [Bdellovibrionales bacterium CG10_big_fil_rev_8_21_14_0_10_45_34]